MRRFEHGLYQLLSGGRVDDARHASRYLLPHSRFRKDDRPANLSVTSRPCHSQAQDFGPPSSKNHMMTTNDFDKIAAVAIALVSRQLVADSHHHISTHAQLKALLSDNDSPFQRRWRESFEIPCRTPRDDFGRGGRVSLQSWPSGYLSTNLPCNAGKRTSLQPIPNPQPDPTTTHISPRATLQQP